MVTPINILTLCIAPVYTDTLVLYYHYSRCDNSVRVEQVQHDNKTWKPSIQPQHDKKVEQPDIVEQRQLIESWPQLHPSIQR